MAAIALTAATLTACSNEEEPTINEIPFKKGNVITLTATLQPQDAATRSLLTGNGDGSVSAEWQVGDRLYLNYQTSDGYVEGEATVTAVDPSTKAATIRAELTNPKDDGWIDFVFPYDYNNILYGETNIYNGQKGTLADIGANWVYYNGYAKMSVTGGNASLSGSVSLSAYTCIWKFSFINGSTDITSSITELNIVCGDESYIVSPSNQSAIYVSMRGASNKEVYLIARTASDVYIKTQSKKITLTAGKMYTSTGLALTKVKPMAEATTDDIGKVIGQDGMIYENSKLATACGTTGVAMIAYVGTEGVENGLAIALEDESSETMIYDEAVAACGAKAPVAGKYWRLPTSPDWQYMFIGCGSESSMIPTASLNNVTRMNCMNFLSKLGKVGKKMTYDRDYWTATKTGYILHIGDLYVDQVWKLQFNFSQASYGAGRVDMGSFTRAVLAF